MSKITIVAASLLVVAGATVIIIKTNNHKEQSATENTSIKEENAEIQAASIEWWTIKTNTGIPTLVAELKNNNAVPIDINFDVDYYKDGEIIKTRDDLYAISIPTGEGILIYDTWEIPESADKIRINYTYLAESTRTSVPVIITSEKQTQDTINLEYKINDSFEEFDAYIAYFLNDKLVAFDEKSFFQGEELTWSSTPLEKFDTYRLYTKAYK